MTTDERAQAAAQIAGWYWQPAEARNFRYKYAVKTFTRYYECAPVAADTLKLVIEYLREQDVAADGKLSVLGKDVEGFAGYKAKEAWYQTVPGDKWEGTQSEKVRIYQTFFAAGSSDDDGPYTIEDGCQYKVEHTFYWSVTALPTLPASSSGVAYSMQGVTRDRETGLFSCAIEKRTRVQQDVALYRSGGTIYETVSEEQHLGVKQSNVASTGMAASAGGGVIVERKVSKNADCTSNVENRKRVENAIAQAVVETRQTLRATVTTTRNRNQGAALPTTGLADGEVRRSEKTDGGRYDNTVTTVVKRPTGVIEQSCSDTGVVHTDRSVESVAAQPAIAHVVTSPNHEVSASARKTEEGMWDKTTSVVVYSGATTGTVTHGSAAVTRRSVTAINQTSVPSPGAGGTNVVNSVSASPNDHGSYSVTTTTDTYQPNSQTATGGTVDAAETTEVGTNQTSVPAGSVGVNRRVDVSVSLNDHGSMSTSRRTIVYSPRTATAIGGSLHASDTTVVSTNQTTVPTPTLSTNRRNDVSVSLNDHGSMTVSQRTTTYSPVSATATSANSVMRRTTTVTRHSTATTAQATQGEASIEPDDTGATSTRVTEVTPIAVQSPWIEWTSETKTPSATLTYSHKVMIFRNLSNPPTPPTGYDADLSVSINEYGKYDGKVSCRKLVSWTSGSGGGGGIQGGTVKVPFTKNGIQYYRVYRVTYVTGSGNESEKMQLALKASKITSIAGATCFYEYLREEKKN